jgi:DNA-binding transcriptional ArsR family regulator
VDLVFRAMADSGRRALLDALFERDGQSLGELCTVLPDLTRFGVMKHLGVLEAAHLVTTEKIGREKFHYLNPVPIREVHDRWVSKFAEPWAAAMVDLRKNLEGDRSWSAPVTSSRPTSARRQTRSGKR